MLVYQRVSNQPTIQRQHAQVTSRANISACIFSKAAAFSLVSLLPLISSWCISWRMAKKQEGFFMVFGDFFDQQKNAKNRRVSVSGILWPPNYCSHLGQLFKLEVSETLILSFWKWSPFQGTCSLVGGFNPFEKYARQIGSFRWTSKIFETTTQIIQYYTSLTFLKHSPNTSNLVVWPQNLGCILINLYLPTRWRWGHVPPVYLPDDFQRSPQSYE